MGKQTEKEAQPPSADAACPPSAKDNAPTLSHGKADPQTPGGEPPNSHKVQRHSFKIAKCGSSADL